MSIATRVTATALALLSFSAPALADNSFAAHEALVSSISSVGVDVYLNPSQVCDGKIHGAYISGLDALVVCQDNATPGGQQVEWTENDLDTLRHEAQHLIQDCMDGALDGNLQSVYKYPIVLGLDVIGPEGVASVSKAYHDAGSNVIIMEIEAFAVAAMDDPLEQVQDIKKYCF